MKINQIEQPLKYFMSKIMLIRIKKDHKVNSIFCIFLLDRMFDQKKESFRSLPTELQKI